MGIKSLEELKQIRDQSQGKVSLRQGINGQEDTIEVLIGMATCGISSGARETLNAFVEELNKQGITNARIISVGCIGYCHSEPTVQVNMKGKEPVLYGNVKKDKVAEIVEKHIKGDSIVESLLIKSGFDRV